MALSKKRQKLVDSVNALSLIVVAFLGGIYELVHIFGPKERLDAWISQEGILISLVSLLCFGVGTERLLTLRKLEEGIHAAKKQRGTILSNLNKLLKLQASVEGELKEVEKKESDIFLEFRRINTSEIFMGTSEIEAAAQELIQRCGPSDTIRATGRYFEESGLSDQYFKTLIDKVKWSEGKKGDMEYHVIVFPKPDPHSGSEDQRKKLFEESAIQKRLRTRFAKNPWPFEVLIGGRSVILALHGGGNLPTYAVAVRITDSEFVEKASAWFQVQWEKETDKSS